MYGATANLDGDVAGDVDLQSRRHGAVKHKGETPHADKGKCTGYAEGGQAGGEREGGIGTCASSVDAPRCGVHTKLGCAMRLFRWSFGGSDVNTSSAAPATCRHEKSRVVR